VPLGEGFLEIVSIADEREAALNPFGRAVTAATADADASFLSWAVDAGDGIEEVSERLEIPASPLKRALPDGGHVTYTVAGLQQAMEQPPLPFFVQWLSKEDRPDQTFVDHEVDPTGFLWLELACDKRRLSGWLDDHPFPLQYIDGHPGISAVGIAVHEGEPIILRAPLDLNPRPSPRAELAADVEPPEGEGFSEEEGSSEGEAEEEEQPSAFAKVLEFGIESAVDLAAGAMEAMAGGVTSPRELGLQEGDHEG